MIVAPFGERAVELVVASSAEATRDPSRAAARSRAVARAVEAMSIADVIDVVVGYGTVVVHLAPSCDAAKLAEEVESRLPASAIAIGDEGDDTCPADEHIVRVVYDGADLREVADLHDLSPRVLAELHAAPTYVAEILGFMPGFAYLGVVDPRIATPRLSTPRSRVPSGAVAIADARTAIYPAASPGGWRLLGRAVDFAAFDPSRASPSAIAAGDRVRFEIVDVVG